MLRLEGKNEDPGDGDRVRITTRSELRRMVQGRRCHLNVLAGSQYLNIRVTQAVAQEYGVAVLDGDTQLWALDKAHDEIVLYDQLA